MFNSLERADDTRLNWFEVELQKLCICSTKTKIHQKKFFFFLIIFVALIKKNVLQNWLKERVGKYFVKEIRFFLSCVFSGRLNKALKGLKMIMNVLKLFWNFEMQKIQGSHAELWNSVGLILNLKKTILSVKFAIQRGLGCKLDLPSKCEEAARDDGQNLWQN